MKIRRGVLGSSNCRKLAKCCGSGKYDSAVSKLEGVGFLAKQTIMEFAQMLSLSDAG